MKKLPKSKYMYVAYVDVLGYKHAIDSSPTDILAHRRLHCMFDNYINAFTACEFFDDSGTDRYAGVKKIAFSDSIYFASKELPILLDMLQSFFCAVYFWRGASDYNYANGDWIPYIRAGIEYGWIEHFYDPSLTSVNHLEGKFRNPVGSGISKAYWFTEQEPALPGMRIFFRKNLLEKEHSDLTLSIPLKLINDKQIYIDYAPSSKDILEVYWPLNIIQLSDNAGFHHNLKNSRKQFSNASSYKHYNATLDLFMISVLISEDENAIRVWNRSNSLLQPL